MPLGHEVHLVCQERDPAGLGFVDSIGSGRKASSSCARSRNRRTQGAARSTAPTSAASSPSTYTTATRASRRAPSTGSSTQELDHYLDANVAAVREVAEAFDPDVALANHLVMGPVILARALDDVPYAVKIHGSALEYTVKPHYQRFAPYAREGLVPGTRRARGLAAYGGEPLGGDGFRGPAASERASARPASTRTRSRRFRRPSGEKLSMDWCAGSRRASVPASTRRAAEALDRLCDPDRETEPDGGALEAIREDYDRVGIDVDAPLKLASIDP